ncbi:hypothetical protein ACH489_17875 [Streptomyces rubiginosohelvolus]|uniref:hypothetical protein n=1 Tax=Streptomyces rubiginosohelvolus TaxID=67362 RepID=UPI0037883615
MTVVLLLALGCVVGWASRSAIDAVRAVRLERRGVVRPNAAQTRSEIRARTRRAEEQMRRAVFRGRM